MQFRLWDCAMRLPPQENLRSHNSDFLMILFFAANAEFVDVFGK
jgi:hypothetical protein